MHTEYTSGSIFSAVTAHFFPFFLNSATAFVLSWGLLMVMLLHQAQYLLFPLLYSFIQYIRSFSCCLFFALFHAFVVVVVVVDVSFVLSRQFLAKKSSFFGQDTSSTERAGTYISRAYALTCIGVYYFTVFCPPCLSVGPLNREKCSLITSGVCVCVSAEKELYTLTGTMCPVQLLLLAEKRNFGLFFLHITFARIIRNTCVPCFGCLAFSHWPLLLANTKTWTREKKNRFFVIHFTWTGFFGGFSLGMCEVAVVETWLVFMFGWVVIA